MADKDIDRKGSGWLGKKLAEKSGKIDNLGLLKEALVNDALERKPIQLSILMTCAAGMIGTMGGVVNDGLRSDYVETADPALVYSDTGAGYEVIKYADNQPAVALIREADGDVRLYNVYSNGVMQQLSEREAWTVAARVTTVLQERIEQLRSPEAALGADGFLPYFPAYDSISLAWANTGQGGETYRRHASGETRAEIPVNFADLDDKYSQELAEWQAVRTLITEGQAAGAPNPESMGDGGSANAASRQFIEGQIAVSGLVLSLFGLMIGNATLGGYRRRKERAEANLRRNTP